MNFSFIYFCTIETDSDDIASKLTGKFSGVEAPWPGKLPEGCDMLTTGECPLEAGVPATAELDLPISPLFPPVRISVSGAYTPPGGVYPTRGRIPPLENQWIRCNSRFGSAI